MNYYADIKGTMHRINWVAYERLKMMGWCHRILDEHQAVLHFIGGVRK